MRLRLWIAAVLVGTLVLPGAAQAKKYKVDEDHTTVGFRIRHLFTYVEGRFNEFEGEFVFDPNDLSSTKVKGTVDVGSIDTNVEERDKHLRSKDFFDAEKYPKIEFESTGVIDVDKEKNTGKLSGKLTIHGVTKPVVLDVTFRGEATDPWGNKKAGFSGETTINRKDFGLNWNEVLETGSLLVGEEVQLRIEVEAYVQE